MRPKGPEQAGLMAQAVNSARFAKKVGIPGKVADEFYRPDRVARRKGFNEGGPVVQRGDGVAVQGKTRGEIK